MFNSITGKLTFKGQKVIFLDKDGLEFEISMPQTNIDALGEEGSVVRVFTYLLHTEAAMSLFGFSSAKEREVFFALLKVSGVGAKSAVKILSSVTSDRLLSIIEQEDVASLEKVQGVGKTGAKKVILALKGKLVASSAGQSEVTFSGNPYAAVAQSVIDMGYDKKAVAERLGEVVQTLQSDETFQKLTKTAKEDKVFRALLTSLV